jgi:dihydrofolate reductase
MAIMRISILAAVSDNGVIGRDGKLPWHLSDDLRRFKRLTMGHTIVMGRRTWESIGRPLPGRRTIVVSRQLHYRVDAEDVKIADSLDEALRIAEEAGEKEVFIVGGAEIYKLALPQADRLYLTCVMSEREIDGDTYFPSDELNWDEWCNVSSETHDADERNDYLHVFQIFDRCERR